MKKRWKAPSDDGSRSDEMAQSLGIPPLLARMLVSRGLEDPAKAWAFLHPRLEDLHDPFLMQGMERAVGRILQARDRRERVLVYGDYDVDGITSTVILKRTLEMIGVLVDFHLPRRLEDGYGLQEEVIRDCHRRGIGLVVTADSGIRAFEVCHLARQLGLEIIVTDHHLPDDQLPEAYAILNPRQPGCQYPDKDLAAVGVVFKLVHALFRSVGREEVIPHFLKLVAIGTIADLVPLTGENRIIAKFGLAGLSDPRNVGLKALLRGAGVEEEVSHFDVSFKVAPRMNAVTRMGGGREVVDLFSAETIAEAESIVVDMNLANQRRREEEQQILEEIERRIQDQPREFDGTFLVIGGRNWHRGVIGIVASRLVDRFYRPCLVVSLGDAGCQASGRSIPGFHLLQAMDSCRDLLTKYGGHAQAVGCSFGKGSDDGLVGELRERLDAYARSRLTDMELIPTLNLDGIVPIEDLNLSLYDLVQRLAPFGVGNPVPLFATRRVPVAAGPWVLKERHLKFLVQKNGSRLDAVWWRHADAADAIRMGGVVDIAYSLERECYRGEEKLTLVLRDLREGGTEG